MSFYSSAKSERKVALEIHQVSVAPVSCTAGELDKSIIGQVTSQVGKRFAAGSAGLIFYAPSGGFLYVAQVVVGM